MNWRHGSFGQLLLENSLEYYWNQWWWRLWIWVNVFIVEGDALEGQLCFVDHPELDWFYLDFNLKMDWKENWTSRDSVSFCIAANIGLYFACGWRTSTSTSAKSRTSFWRYTGLIDVNVCWWMQNLLHLFGIEGMAKFILDVKLNMYREKWMSCRKGVWKFVSFTGVQLGIGATWPSLSPQWCNWTMGRCLQQT